MDCHTKKEVNIFRPSFAEAELEQNGGLAMHELCDSESIRNNSSHSPS